MASSRLVPSAPAPTKAGQREKPTIWDPAQRDFADVDPDGWRARTNRSITAKSILSG
jgi:hypothetical protein